MDFRSIHQLKRLNRSAGSFKDSIKGPNNNKYHAASCHSMMFRLLTQEQYQKDVSNDNLPNCTLIQ